MTTKDLAEWEKFSKQIKVLDNQSKEKLVTYTQGLIDGRKIAENQPEKEPEKKTG